MTNLIELRKQKDWFFENDHHSPLPAELKESFQGLSYYPENSQLRFDAANRGLFPKFPRPVPPSERGPRL